MFALDDNKTPVKMHRCSGEGGNQYFEYDDGLICRDNLCVQYQEPGLVLKDKRHSPKLTKVSMNFNDCNQIV
jgi:hypothetical protein